MTRISLKSVKYSNSVKLHAVGKPRVPTVQHTWTVYLVLTIQRILSYLCMARECVDSVCTGCWYLWLHAHRPDAICGCSLVCFRIRGTPVAIVSMISYLPRAPFFVLYAFCGWTDWVKRALCRRAWCCNARYYAIATVPWTSATRWIRLNVFRNPFRSGCRPPEVDCINAVVRARACACVGLW